jgi:hypothetical protein
VSSWCHVEYRRLSIHVTQVNTLQENWEIAICTKYMVTNDREGLMLQEVEVRTKRPALIIPSGGGRGLLQARVQTLA